MFTKLRWNYQWQNYNILNLQQWCSAKITQCFYCLSSFISSQNSQTVLSRKQPTETKGPWHKISNDLQPVELTKYSEQQNNIWEKLLSRSSRQRAEFNREADSLLHFINVDSSLHSTELTLSSCCIVRLTSSAGSHGHRDHVNPDYTATDLLLLLDCHLPIACSQTVCTNQL